jgi:hypothetical protein
MSIFRRKLAKISENCGHNIGPRLGEISPFGQLFTLGSVLKMTEIAQNFWLLFPTMPTLYYF